MRGARAAGVSWFSRDKRWTAVIRVDAGDGKGKTRFLGRFVNEVDAALAYDQAARQYHGKKAQLNFPDLPPKPQMAPSKTRQPTPQPSLKHILQEPQVPSRKRPHHPTSQYRGKRRCT
jgi:hypothetical protein